MENTSLQPVTIRSQSLELKIEMRAQDMGCFPFGARAQGLHQVEDFQLRLIIQLEAQADGCEAVLVQLLVIQIEKELIVEVDVLQRPQMFDWERILDTVPGAFRSI